MLLSVYLGFLIHQRKSDYICAPIGSPKLSRNIKADYDLQQEVALLPVTNSTEYLQAISCAFHCDTEIKDGRVFLSRSRASRSQLQETDLVWFQMKITTLTKRLESLQTKYQSFKNPSIEALKEAEARFAARSSNSVPDTSSLQAMELTPVAALLIHTLSELNRKQLQFIKPGQNIVFSNYPVGGEIPLSITTDNKWLNQYLKSQSDFTHWSLEASKEGKIAPKHEWIFPHRAFHEGQHTILLTINRRQEEPSFTLSVFDQEGSREAEITTKADGWNTESEIKDNSLGKMPLSNELQKRIASKTLGDDQFQISQLNPDESEPLGFEVEEALRDLAKAKGFDQVIACVPDSLLLESSNFISGKDIDLDHFNHILVKRGIESIPVGKTLVFRPANPFQEETLRVIRQPLVNLFKTGLAEDFGMQPLLQYHESYSEIFGHSPSLDIIERPIREAFGLYSINSTLPHALLCLLGELTEGQRQSLVRGTLIPLNSPGLYKTLLAIAELPLTPTNKVNRSDIEKTPLRILASSGSLWLRCQPERQYSMLKRVVRGYSEHSRLNKWTGRQELVKGDNVSLDDAFQPLGVIAEGDLSDSNLMNLQTKYLFEYETVVPVKLQVVFGDVATSPFFTMEYLMGRSQKPVSLADVPGIR